MAYTQLTMSPVTIEYALSRGANGLHVGILGALPAAMLFMQFLAAIAANHLTYRRPCWLAVTILQRLALVPVAVAPFLFDGVSDRVWIWALILATAVNHALIHFGTPLWLSWMGDYLPHQGLSRYWGKRHLWMQWTAAVSLVAGALLFYYSGLEIQTGFSLLILAGAVIGVADLMFFLKVDEPPVTRVPNPRLGKVLAAPFRQPGFRSFIGYNCIWQFAVMIGAPFITLYLLSHTGMSLFQLLMLWAFAWVGGAVFAQRLGSLIETFGHRPVLVLCTILKSSNMLALLWVPTTSPTLTFWILVPVFMFDALLNAGIAIAANGFMLTNSPAENRTMYIAAGTAMAGMVGGLTSIAAGGMLALTGGWQFTIAGAEYNNFHVLFAVSIVMRLLTTIVALRIDEPQSRGTYEVVTLLIGATPFRMLRFPVGLYGSFRGTENRKLLPQPDSCADRAA
jgi:MFS family permease